MTDPEQVTVGADAVPAIVQVGEPLLKCGLDAKAADAVRPTATSTLNAMRRIRRMCVLLLVVGGTSSRLRVTCLANADSPSTALWILVRSGCGKRYGLLRNATRELSFMLPSAAAPVLLWGPDPSQPLEDRSSRTPSRSDRREQLVAAGVIDQPEQLAERLFFDHRVAERQVGIHPIHVAASVSATSHIPGLL